MSTTMTDRWPVDKATWDRALAHVAGPDLAQRSVWMYYAAHSDYATGDGIYVRQTDAKQVLGISQRNVGRCVKAGAEQGWITRTGDESSRNGYRLSIPVAAVPLIEQELERRRQEDSWTTR